MKRQGFQFKLRGTAIYASFSHQGKKFYESLNILLESEKHFSIKERALTKAHRGYIQDNEKLLNYEAKIRNWIFEAEKACQNKVDYVKNKLKEEELLSKSEFKNHNGDSLLYKTLYDVVQADQSYIQAKEKGIRGTYFEYNAILGMVSDYEIKNNVVLQLKEVSYSLIDSIFKFFSCTHNNYNGDFENPHNYKKFQVKAGLGATTLHNRWATFKKLLNFIDERLFKLNPKVFTYKRKKAETKTPIIFSCQEFSALMNYQPTIEEVEFYDYLMVSVGTGLNFKDIYDIQSIYFTKMKAFYKINLKRNKNRMKCEIPLTDYIYRIFDKHNFKMNFMSNKKFNDSLRNLFCKLPIFDKFDLLHQEENSLETPLKRSEILSHKFFRSTYISFCSDLQIPEVKIQNRVGHIDGRMMKHYNNREERDIDAPTMGLIKKVVYVAM